MTPQINRPRKPRSIQTIKPHSFQGIIGNGKLKTLIAGIANQLKPRIDASDMNPLPYGQRYLLKGGSRTGKTMMIIHLIRMLTCLEANLQTMSVCDMTCPACFQRIHIDGNSGTFAALGTYGDSGRAVVDYFPIDATLVTADEFRKTLVRINHASRLANGLAVVFIDEVHRLARRELDDMLLKSVEDVTALWFLATAEPQKLEQMLINRCQEFETELPTPSELDGWLVNLCEEGGLEWTPEGIAKVGAKVGRNPGLAQKELATAQVLGRTLDENYDR